MFRKILITSIATVGLVSAMQASAHTLHKHSNNHHHNAPAPKSNYNISVNINLLLTLITNGVRNNSLSHHEENLSRQDYKRITQLRTNYNRGGIQRHEHRQLETHIKNAQKRVRDYSKNSKRRVVKKKQRAPVKHVHKPAIKWQQRPVRKQRSQRGSRMNRQQRGQIRCNNRLRGNRCGKRKGITLSNNHGSIRFNKHGVQIRINH